MIGTLTGGPHDGITFNMGKVEDATEAPAIIAIDAHVYSFGTYKTKHAPGSNISSIEAAAYEYRGEG